MIFRASNHFGEAPINNQRFAVFSQHHVAGLQIPMQYAPAVRILDRVTNVDESSEKLA